MSTKTTIIKKLLETQATTRFRSCHSKLLKMGKVPNRNFTYDLNLQSKITKEKVSLSLTVIQSCVLSTQPNNNHQNCNWVETMQSQ